MKHSLLMLAAVAGLLVAPTAAADHDGTDGTHECTMFEAWVYPGQAHGDHLFEVWLYTAWLENDCGDGVPAVPVSSLLP